MVGSSNVSESLGKWTEDRWTASNGVGVVGTVRSESSKVTGVWYDNRTTVDIKGATRKGWIEGTN